MGLTSRTFFRTALLLIGLLGSLNAAPKLRLATSTFGPYSIATGANGEQQIVEAYNAGDGSLALTASSSATWLTASVGASRGCVTITKPACLPIQLGFQTSSLAVGTHTGVVTLSDPNAVDAPQTLVVTVTMGGGIPDKLDMYVAPNGSSTQTTISSNTSLPFVKNGDWLQVASGGMGSYQFGMTYRVTAKHSSGMGEGDYIGAIGFSGSSFALDNRNVQVNLHVTSRPLADAPAKLSFRAIKDSAKQTQALTVNNRGLATLSVTGASVSMTPSGTWLTAGTAGTTTNISADPTGLAVGTYSGSVTLTTNAANGNAVVPVELVVVPVGPPQITYRGAVNIGSWKADDAVAPGDIISVWGEQFGTETKNASALPLPTQLGSIRVLVNGQAAPLYFVSPGQINIQLPLDTSIGEVAIKVERDGQTGNAVSATVAARAPHILPFYEYGIIHNYSRNVTFPMPPVSGVPTARAQVGDVLVMYTTGLGQADPPVATGAAAPAAEPLARITAPLQVHFGERVVGSAVTVAPMYVGMTGGLAGLYQVNVAVPDGVQKGDRVPLYIDCGGKISNTVLIAIE